MRAAIVVLLGAAGCLTASVLQEAAQKAGSMRNPFEGSEQDRRAGARLFARECASCHGKDRQGLGKAPPLNRDEVRHAPPGVIFWVLENGSLRHGMPSFASLPAPQRWQIITFLQH